MQKCNYSKTCQCWQYEHSLWGVSSSLICQLLTNVELSDSQGLSQGRAEPGNTIHIIYINYIAVHAHRAALLILNRPTSIVRRFLSVELKNVTSYINYMSFQYKPCRLGQSDPSKTQNICITFIQCWTNVEDVGPTLYKCYTNVLCLLGRPVPANTRH